MLTIRVQMQRLLKDRYHRAKSLHVVVDVRRGHIPTVVETEIVHCQRCGPRRTLLFIGIIAVVKVIAKWTILLIILALAVLR